MKALIGRKLGMTQTIADSGEAVAVTVLQAGPCVVTALKTTDHDGYEAVQLGFGKARRPGKALKGQASSGDVPAYKKEFRMSPSDATELKLGDQLDVSQFAVGETVRVTAVSKGKGFAGTIKRHNFKRGPKSHGSKSYRAPGSIGSMYPQHIFKGKKMAGRMGHEQVTLKGLKVMDIDGENQLLVLSGPVPGPRKSLIFISGEEAHV